MPETVENQFSYYSGKAGDLSRQLGLAALALVWLFHGLQPHNTLDGNPATAIPRAVLSGEFKLPILLVVVSLSVDAVQYVLGTVLWGCLAFGGHDGEFAVDHKGVAGAQTILILLKLCLMLVAYCFLFRTLWDSVKWEG